MVGDCLMSSMIFVKIRGFFVVLYMYVHHVRCTVLVGLLPGVNVRRLPYKGVGRSESSTQDDNK